MKNASRSKFLLCFRPVDVDMEMVVESKPAPKARTKLIENPKVEKTKVVDKEKEEVKVVQAPLTKTMSLDRERSMISSQSSKQPRSRHSRTLSKAFKAVVFETILARKVQDNRAFRQDSFGSKRSYDLSLRIDELMNTSSETNSDQVRVNSDSGKQSMKNQEDSVKKSKKNEKGSCELNFGMCLLLISLAVTVFWGRVLAILFTTIWLYFFSWRCANSNLRRPENVRQLSEAESREQKRRVIMEGLIERNHHFNSSQRRH